MTKVLIVEDEASLADIIRTYLLHAGYEANIAYSCKEAQELLEQSPYDIVLLDMVLPDGTGDSLCEMITGYYNCPIIFISCLDDSETIIAALENGGDDYVIKPVRYNELIARVDANIRRSRRQMRMMAVQNRMRRFASFAMDTVRRRVVCEEREVDLSAIEYSLLEYLTNHPGELILYDDLYHQVWKDDSLGDVRTVMVHISNLRKKIDPDKRGVIETVRGAGYVFTNI